METTLKLGSIVADLVRKDIKNVHLSVYPPAGRVRISAPTRMNVETIRTFAVSKLGWIKTQQKQIIAQERESPREYLDRESHYVWGKRYLLDVVESERPARVELAANRLVLYVRSDSDAGHKESILERWYREELRRAAGPMVSRWEKVLGLNLDAMFVRRMKTKWGSCSRTARTIRLNTELAKKPPECTEYVVFHEMVHLIEPNHGAEFRAIMDKFMPAWQKSRTLLNRLPVRHEDWLY